MAIPTPDLALPLLSVAWTVKAAPVWPDAHVPGDQVAEICPAGGPPPPQFEVQGPVVGTSVGVAVGVGDGCGVPELASGDESGVACDCQEGIVAVGNWRESPTTMPVSVFCCAELGLLLPGIWNPTAASTFVAVT